MGDAAEAAGDLEQHGMALYRTSLAYLRGHRLEDALDFAARAQALADETGDQTVLAGSLVTTGWVQAVSGNLDAAIEAMQTALPVASSQATRPF